MRRAPHVPLTRPSRAPHPSYTSPGRVPCLAIGPSVRRGSRRTVDWACRPTVPCCARAMRSGRGRMLRGAWAPPSPACCGTSTWVCRRPASRMGASPCCRARMSTSTTCSGRATGRARSHTTTAAGAAPIARSCPSSHGSGCKATRPCPTPPTTRSKSSSSTTAGRTPAPSWARRCGLVHRTSPTTSTTPSVCRARRRSSRAATTCRAAGGGSPITLRPRGRPS